MPDLRKGRASWKVGRTRLLLAGGFLLLALLFLWVGDQSRLRAIDRDPPPGATAVSVRTVIRLAFAAPITADQRVTLTLKPEVSGVLIWEEASLIFRPERALLPNTAYEVVLSPGLRTEGGRTLSAPLTWRFETGEPRILYLAWDQAGLEQLFVADASGLARQQLSQAAAGVIDFGVDPALGHVAFSTRGAGGTSALWWLPAGTDRPRLALDCGDLTPAANCSKPVWHPFRERLIFERRNLERPGGPLQQPQLYWLDVRSGETVPVFADDQWLAHGASFSPDGAWLSYVSPADIGVRVRSLVDGSDILVPSAAGLPAWWHPTLPRLIVTDLHLLSTGFAMHLIQFDLEGDASVNVSGELDVEDGPPTFAPDGRRLAFGRKAARTSMGKQIWLYDFTDGSSRRLTDDAAFHHGSLAWSPTGDAILMQRFAVAEPDARPDIWVYTLATGQLRQIAPVGMQPAWLP